MVGTSQLRRPHVSAGHRGHSDQGETEELRAGKVGILVAMVMEIIVHLKCKHRLLTTAVV